ncbi:MAG TPA: hypothetical protein PKW90_29265, partial [Myxococcota bacterium]|nr:hypothetical protein [Myxococcota bacterium]
MDALFDELVGLSEEEWTVLLWRLSDLKHAIPGPQTGRKVQVAELAGAARRQGREAELRTALDQLREEGKKPQENLEGWLEKLHRRHGQLR